MNKHLFIGFIFLFQISHVTFAATFENDVDWVKRHLSNPKKSSLHEALPKATSKVPEKNDYDQANNDKNYLTEKALNVASNNELAKLEQSQYQQKQTIIENNTNQLKSQSQKLSNVAKSQSTEAVNDPCQGSCDTLEPQSAKADFGKSISKLNAVTSAGDDVKENNKDELFTGVGMKCHKTDGMGVDCCNMDRGTSRCNHEEHALSKAIKSGRVYFVSHYHDKDNGYIKYFEYCVFKSKMALIIQSQGRVNQLHQKLSKNFCYKRNSKHHKRCDITIQKPQCNGITSAQLSQIDFDRIDFSLVEENLKSKTKSPNIKDELEKVKSKSEVIQ